jgi:acetylornithine deacetylase/succinyl-diaminopimelate desuccinylase-like protein
VTDQPSSAEDEVVDLCRDLIRIDSSNPTSNERKAAEYVAGKLEEVGLTSQIIESEPGRTSVIARMEGTDPSREALLIHGHLDVVPADASEWSVDPFGGEIVDDMLWGRGAVDMKDMDAMILSVVRHRMRTGQKPPRDVVLAFLPDEEAGGAKGAHWLVDNKPELFEGCTAAISEVGGFSITVAEDQRLYLIQTAEKGMAWMKLTAKGRAGHGSFLNDDNAVTALTEAVTRIGRHTFPVQLTPTVRRFLEELSDSLHVELDPDDIENTVAKLGSIARIIGATLRHTANPTMLDAGYKVNVIPRTASASIDARFLPGLEDDFYRQFDELLGPDVQREFIHHDIAVETEWETAMVEAMCAAIKAEDPQGRPVPYTLSGGTDAKSFSELGMKCYGFSPLRLPADLDFAGMFHGVDERVPLDSLRFGARVLDRFLSDT